MLTEFHIGIDDTDSKMGGCTTYTAALLFEELSRRGFEPTDFPWLVRLNPNIPWKTRGNGALAIHTLVDSAKIEEVKRVALQIVKETTDPSVPSTDPAVVFLVGPTPRILKDFSRRALYDVLSVGEARNIGRSIRAEVHLFARARGLVGALAAVGSELDDDHTFEIIAYRAKRNLGTPRRVDMDSIRKMDSNYSGKTFNNIDYETGRILICPHGPDPVLLGIRGEDPSSLVDAFRSVRVDEPIERIMLFKTNHGTDAHLTRQRSIQTLRPHESAAVTGTVETACRVLQGGHVFFTLRDETGTVDCAAYAPLGSFRQIVRQLVPGDVLKAYGGVRRGLGARPTLNLEKLEIQRLAEDASFENPRCLSCGSRCESMGVNQGFRCRRCNSRYRNASRIRVVRNRELTRGVFIPPPRAHRHLTRPTSRPLPEQRAGFSGLSKPLGYLAFSKILQLSQGPFCDVNWNRDVRF